MPDRERVVAALECLADGRFCACCRYKPYDDCSKRVARDALILLKEQEAVEPEVDVLNEIDRLYRCPKCHKHFLYRKQKYCDQCGQAVKWE